MKEEISRQEVNPRSGELLYLGHGGDMFCSGGSEVRSWSSASFGAHIVANDSHPLI